MTTIISTSNFRLDDKFSDLLKDFLKETPNGLAPIVKKHALNIQAQSAKDAPVDTGALKNSMIADAIDDSNYTIHDGVEYGVYQELGTSKVSAKHFLGGACEREAGPFFKDVREALKK